MAFGVSALAKSPGDPLYYDPSFRTMLETHMGILRHGSISPRRSITADKIHQFEGDFYGLLNDLGIPMEHHWVYMRTNGFHSPTEFGTQGYNPYISSIRFDLILPSAEYLRQLVVLYRSTRQ